MHLGKRVKLNMIIAILLCMAFVVNFGSTISASSYNFVAKTSTSQNEETYTPFASAQSATGKYTYSTGSANNQLSIDYGFSYEYDLMLKFTATYTNGNHIANDFSLNFVNRDSWCVDMGQTSQSLKNTTTGVTTTTNYYNLTSTSNTLTGVMYYMDTLEDSGTLPIISGVTFYTSPNGSYNYIGDTLTVTFTPVYVKSGSYSASHAFSSEAITTEAFTNWYTFMSGTNTFKSMTYNAYTYNTQADRSLQFPSDFAWSASFNLSEQSVPTYANTAYQYTADNKLDMVTSGNKYFGGLGVYVFPSASTKTISVNITYTWQLNGVIQSGTSISIAQLYYADDITAVSADLGTAYYYSATITKPIYIDILEAIMLKSENNYKEYVLQQGHSLVISNVVITEQTSNPANWISSAKPAYEIDNATIQSPVLVRAQDVAIGSHTYETNISIVNNSTNDITIKSGTTFTITSDLWHAVYESEGGEVSSYSKESVTLYNETTQKYEATYPSALKYDNKVWQITQSGNVFTVKLLNSVAYIPAGRALTVITGVEIPTHAGLTYDFWCALEVGNITTATPSYSNGTYTGLEVYTDGYYKTIASGSSASIYVRNNTNQTISQISLLSLAMREVGSNSTLLPRDQMSDNNFGYTVTYFDGKTSTFYNNPGSGQSEFSTSAKTVNIAPNEMILLCTISPTSKNAIIYSYQVQATLTSGAVTSGLDMKYDEIAKTGELTNNTDTHYEFRLVSDANISSYLVNSGDYVAQGAVDGVYYYYYKGVICAGQTIKLVNGLSDTRGISIQYKEHSGVVTEAQYVASNYGDWSDVSTEWLSAMQSIYGNPKLVNQAS